MKMRLHTSKSERYFLKVALKKNLFFFIDLTILTFKPHKNCIFMHWTWHTKFTMKFVTLRRKRQRCLSQSIYQNNNLKTFIRPFLSTTLLICRNRQYRTIIGYSCHTKYSIKIKSFNAKLSYFTRYLYEIW